MKEESASSKKFCELCQSFLASYCVTVLNCNKVETAQAKTGGLSCGWVEPTRGEGLYWGDKSREQGASAWKLARAFGKSADSLGGANECRALLTVLYPGSGRSLAASCPSCPCEMWKINRLEGADGSKHTHTHTPTIECGHTHQCACVDEYTHHRAYTHIDMHTQTHRQAHPHSGTNTLRPGSLWYHIMRAPARPSHEASAEMIQGSPLGPHSISQVELPTRTDSRTATLRYSPLNVEMSWW